VTFGNERGDGHDREREPAHATAIGAPVTMWRSVPQIVDVVIRTIASPESRTTGLGFVLLEAPARPVVDERFHDTRRSSRWTIDQPFNTLHGSQLPDTCGGALTRAVATRSCGTSSHAG